MSLEIAVWVLILLAFLCCALWWRAYNRKMDRLDEWLAETRKKPPVSSGSKVKGER